MREQSHTSILKNTGKNAKRKYLENIKLKNVKFS